MSLTVLTCQLVWMLKRGAKCLRDSFVDKGKLSLDVPLSFSDHLDHLAEFLLPLCLRNRVREQCFHYEWSRLGKDFVDVLELLLVGDDLLDFTRLLLSLGPDC